MRLWRDIIQMPYIAYNAKTRKQELAHAYKELAPYIETWEREVAEKKPNRSDADYLRVFGIRGIREVSGDEKMARKRNSQKLWEQNHKDVKFATPEVMSEIKCSQVVANSRMKRAKKEGKKVVRESGFICPGGRDCACGGGGYLFTLEESNEDDKLSGKS